MNKLISIILVILLIFMVGCNYKCLDYDDSFKYTPYFYEYGICTDTCDYLYENINADLWDCKFYCEDEYLTNEKWNYSRECIK